MPNYIVDLWLDGYDTEDEMEKACDEFIYDQLNFTASSERVKRSDYDTLLTKYNELDELKEALIKIKEYANGQNWKSIVNMVNKVITKESK